MKFSTSSLKLTKWSLVTVLLLYLPSSFTGVHGVYAAKSGSSLSKTRPQHSDTTTRPAVVLTPRQASMKKKKSNDDDDVIAHTTHANDDDALLVAPQDESIDSNNRKKTISNNGHSAMMLEESTPFKLQPPTTRQEQSLRSLTDTDPIWNTLGSPIDHGIATYDDFGSAVALSKDGLTLAVSAPFSNGPSGSNSGVITVYRLEKDMLFSDKWSMVGEPIFGQATEDQAGLRPQSISLSDDGNIIAIGARKADNDNIGVDCGNVRIFQYNANGDGGNGSWDQLGDDIYGEAAHDGSGQAVSLSSDGLTVAIGAWKSNGAVDSGYVRVFQYSNGEWIQLGNDLDSEANDDVFGYSVDISKDGNIVAVGGYLGNEDDNGDNRSGYVQVFQYSGTSWEQLGEDINGESAGDNSGIAVALSDNGTIVAIGAPRNDGTNGVDSGHVRVYQYTTTTTPPSWTQLGQDIDGEAQSDKSGRSVDLSSDGNTLAIGARFNDGAGSNAGHVRVYEFNTTAWNQVGSDLDGDANSDEFGYSVSLSGNGDKLAIGAPGGHGHVRVYQRDLPSSSTATDSAASSNSFVASSTKGLVLMAVGVAGAALIV